MQAKTLTSVLLVLTLAMTFNAGAQIVGQANASTVTTSAVGGGTNWTNPSNALLNDDTYTSCLITGGNRPSYNLDIKGWGFQNANTSLASYVPSGATINGIEVSIKLRAVGVGDIRDSKIMLLKAGSETGTNRAKGAYWPEGGTTLTYGSSTDLWDGTWLPTDFFNANFGIRVVARNKGSRDVEAQIDHVSIKLYFNQTFYYSKATGDVTLTTTWGRNSDGTGLTPPDFTSDGQIFFLRNRTATTLVAPMTISGFASKLVVGDSVTASTFTVPQAQAFTGTVDVSPNSSLVVSNPVTPEIVIVSDNTHVTYNGTDQTIYGTTYYNLTLAGSGTKSLLPSTTGKTVVNNVLNIGSGVTLNNNGENIQVLGSANGIVNNGTVTGTGTLFYSLLDASTSISGNGTYANLDLAASTSSSTRTITLAGRATITGTLTLSEGRIDNGSNLMMSNGSTLQVNEGVLVNSIAGSSGYDVVYGSFTNAATKAMANEISGQVDDLTVQTAGGTITLPSNLSLTGDLSVISGTLDATTSNYNITLGGNLTNMATITTRNNTYTFNGSSAQIIGGTAAASFYRLTVNNTNGGVALSVPVTVSNQLALTSGVVTTSSFDLLTLGASATISGGSSSSFVQGPMAQTVTGTSTASRTFPIGSNGAYRPMTLTVEQTTNTANVYTAEVIGRAPTSRTLPADLVSVSSVRYWTVSATGTNIGTAGIRLHYDTDDNVTDVSRLRVAAGSGSSWTNIGGLGSATGSGFINSTTGFNALGDFILARTAGPAGLLPVTLLRFAAKQSGNTVKVDWETTAEENITQHQLERSSNGRDWISIRSMSGRNGNHNKYVFVDAQPLDMNYYRLRMTGAQGSEKFSAIQVVRLEKPAALKLYPNPASATIVHCNVLETELTNSGIVDVTLVDISGRVVYQYKTAAKTVIDIPAATLTPGRYIVQVSNARKKVQSVLVMQ